MTTAVPPERARHLLLPLAARTLLAAVVHCHQQLQRLRQHLRAVLVPLQVQEAAAWLHLQQCNMGRDDVSTDN